MRLTARRFGIVLRLLGVFALLGLSVGAASAQTTALVTFSQAGDAAGGGHNQSFNLSNATFTSYTDYTGTGVVITVEPFASPNQKYQLWFSMPGHVPLQVGSYPYGVENGDLVAGLMVDAPNHCNSLGRFVVREIVRSGPYVVRFAADFEQHCNDGDPALFGAIRFQSNISTTSPFNGAFPSYQLDVIAPEHGTVSGGGIDCGGGGQACTLSPGSPTSVSLSAIPDPGYVFAGWSGFCFGGPETSVNLNMPKQCRAAFSPIVPTTRQTLLAIGSDFTDYVGQGRNEVISTGSKWELPQYSYWPNDIFVNVTSMAGTSESYWNFSFSSPDHSPLAPGYYPNGHRFPFQGPNEPGLDVDSDGRGCNVVLGDFWIHELTRNSDGSIASLAVDFEHRCEGRTVPAPLVGSIRYNTTIPPVGFMRVSLVGNGGITSSPASVSCGLGGSTCTGLFALGSVASLSSQPGPGSMLTNWTGDSVCGSAPFVVAIRMNCTATFENCSMSVTPSAGSSPLLGTTNTFTVTGAANCGWAATAAAPWLTVSGGSGVGPGTFYVASAANGSPGNRTAAVVLNGTTPVTVYQVGRPLVTYDRARWNTDGDTKTDLAVWRASTGMWYSLNSSSLALRAVQWGSSALNDVLVPGDYDGDGLSDIAVWRPADGTWYILRSSVGYASPVNLQWGSGVLHDIPVPGDYDGDGRVDPAVWRPSTGTWYIKTSSSYYTVVLAVPLGDNTQGDQPLVGDYDGDGRADMAVWRPATGLWTILTSHTNYNAALKLEVQWGSDSVGDQPVIGDYDGDGATDIAVWRQTDGTWYILSSSAHFAAGAYVAIPWGSSAAGDIPVRGDFDGDGRSDLAVWRAPTGMWYIRRSSTNFTDYLAVQWGAAALGDVPVTK